MSIDKYRVFVFCEIVFLYRYLFLKSEKTLHIGTVNYY